MKIEIHVQHHGAHHGSDHQHAHQIDTRRQLDVVVDLLTQIFGRIKAMSEEMDRLEVAVSGIPDVLTSIEAVLADFAQQVRDNKDNPARLAKLADDVDEYKARMARAAVNPGGPEPGSDPGSDPGAASRRK